jgi:hypothetical protein
MQDVLCYPVTSAIVLHNWMDCKTGGGHSDKTASIDASVEVEALAWLSLWNRWWYLMSVFAILGIFSILSIVLASMLQLPSRHSRQYPCSPKHSLSCLDTMLQPIYILRT